MACECQIACISEEGCLSQLPTGIAGQILALGDDLCPAWADVDATTASPTAAEVPITDADGYYGSTNVEGALKEIAEHERPWVKEGETQALNSDDVLPTDNIWHMGTMVRGATSIQSPNARFENLSTFASGGGDHTVTGARASVLGGSRNDVTGNDSSIGGGFNNEIIAAIDSFIGSGGNNSVRQGFSLIGAGTDNVIDAPASAIGAGNNNQIFGGPAAGFNAFIGAGASNIVQGQNSAIPGGNNNQVRSANSWGGGVNSRVAAAHNGTFLWHCDNATIWNSAAANEFGVAAAGGFRFRTDAAATIGVDLPPGATAWIAASSVGNKGNFQDVDATLLLARLLTLPVRTYQVKRQKYDEQLGGLMDDGYYDTVNFGATAEDWDSAFGDLLHTNKIMSQRTLPDGGSTMVETPAISMSDQIGVLMATVKALAETVTTQAAQILDLQTQVAGLLV